VGCPYVGVNLAWGDPGSPLRCGRDDGLGCRCGEEDKSGGSSERISRRAIDLCHPGNRAAVIRDPRRSGGADVGAFLRGEIPALRCATAGMTGRGRYGRDDGVRRVLWSAGQGRVPDGPSNLPL